MDALPFDKKWNEEKIHIINKIKTNSKSHDKSYVSMQNSCGYEKITTNWNNDFSFSQIHMHLLAFMQSRDLLTYPT